MNKPILPITLGLASLVPCLLADEPAYTIHTFQKTHLTDTFFSEGAAMGDFNRDGHGDLVSGPFWYAGPDFQTKHEFTPPTPFDPHGYSDNFFAFVHDFNQDQWPDILILGFPGKDTSWFENPHGQSGHWKRHLALAVTDNESPTFTDITGDGLPELVCSSEGYLGYAQPDSQNPEKPWPFTRISPKGEWQRFTHGLGVGDIDGDGRKDFLVREGWWQQPTCLLDKPTWTFHEFMFSPGGGAQMYTYDVDGDGDADVITSLAAHGYGLTWYEQIRQNDQITFVAHTFMNKLPTENKYGVHFSQIHAIDLVDMDGDGLKDLVTGKRYWAHGPNGDPEPGAPAVLYWFKLTRDASGQVDYIPYLIDDNSGVGTQVTTGDLNGDNQVDIVIGNKKGTFVFLHQIRTACEEEWQTAQPKPYSSSQNIE